MKYLNNKKSPEELAAIFAEWEKTKSYKLTGDKFGLSRQRAYQIINPGPKTTKSPRYLVKVGLLGKTKKTRWLVDLYNAPCLICGKPSERFGYKDGNKKNVTPSNMIALCKQCAQDRMNSLRKETAKRVPCKGCKKPILMRYSTHKGYCPPCNTARVRGVLPNRLILLKTTQKKCIDCGVLRSSLPTGKHGSRKRCLRCHQKFRYQNPEVKAKHIASQMKWYRKKMLDPEYAEKRKEYQRTASHKAYLKRRNRELDKSRSL